MAIWVFCVLDLLMEQSFDIYCHIEKVNVIYISYLTLFNRRTSMQKGLYREVPTYFL